MVVVLNIICINSYKYVLSDIVNYKFRKFFLLCYSFIDKYLLIIIKTTLPFIITLLINALIMQQKSLSYINSIDINKKMRIILYFS